MVYEDTIYFYYQSRKCTSREIITIKLDSEKPKSKAIKVTSNG